MNSILLVTLLVFLGTQGRDHQYHALTLKVKHQPFPFTFHNQDSASSSVTQGFSGLFYTDDLYIGTPPQKVNIAIDTGSSPTWVQSAHCTECFNVSFPNFNPDNSITFHPMPSHHPLCVPIWFAPAGNFCQYSVGYIGHQFTKGDVGFDTFTFTHHDVTNDQTGHRHHKSQIQNVAFGCGVVNRIPDLPAHPRPANPVSGILGLGRDHPSSFLLQLRDITLLKFSYCLPRRVGDEASLFFGEEAELKVPAGQIQTTPIVGPSDEFYYLNMTSISLNGSILPIDPKLFTSEGDYGVVIDSGSQYSVFVDAVYQVVRKAMVSYFMDEWLLQALPPNKTRSKIDLCYDITDIAAAAGGRGGLFSVAPRMVFQFDGASLELNQETTFQIFDEFNEFCLMIESANKFESPNIFGAFQQFNHRFVYDVGASKLSFFPEKC
ncbi:aspartic proteinase nepenthesin-1 [Prunus persica]|uniref:aspartic proteinase nepenthesin-1 n=1 Tax=Prunus persica TaxID=3760 RepID=UPI0009ABA7A8|nr:aspartic proteinase nepenthesin-1 [Prunus persica]